MNEHKSIIFFFDHFFPAYKAGGPIQSLIHLIIELNIGLIKRTVTSACDMNSKIPLDGIKINCWNKIALGDNTVVDIWYDNGKSNLFAVISGAKPAVVYLNGIFSYRFFIMPLIVCNRLNIDIKRVICPRGMLQNGALSSKTLKKKMYLAILRRSGLLKNVRWHATNEEEKEDIMRTFGIDLDIVIAPNIPKKPLVTPKTDTKYTGKLKLVYLSLITTKKNLYQLIELVNKSSLEITLDIYGPVKDEMYWKNCMNLIGQSDGRVTYRGDVKPQDVQSTLGEYNAMALLTKGENFGHALYESLSVGRPLITSFFTPWNNLEQKEAGWNVDISDSNQCLQKLENIAEMTGAEFSIYCSGAHKLSIEYYENLNAKEKYNELFHLS